MANALVAIVKSLNKTGELRRRLGDPSAAPAKTCARHPARGRRRGKGEPSLHARTVIS